MGRRKMIKFLPELYKRVFGHDSERSLERMKDTPPLHTTLDIENFLFPLLALWGIKNWLPSIEVKNLKISFNKIGLKGYKWSSLNVPSTGNPLSHSFLGL